MPAMLSLDTTRPHALPALLLLALALCMATGCAKYEFDLTHPHGEATRVGYKADTVIDLAPIEYVLRAAENRLVVKIFNRSDQPIQLLGNQSTVVDPTGQSRPLPPQMIAPHSFAKLILPPLRPRAYETGPTFGIGVGTYVGHAMPAPTTCDGKAFSQPRTVPAYLDVVVYDESLYWNWDGETDIRLILVFQEQGGGPPFTHEFLIHRVKV